ncbi:MAG: hypothetical protein WAM79_07750 [Candidatus Sulfotelmatobacter sp.]
MNYHFDIQYEAADIPGLAATYLATPYKNWTAADEDRLAEEAGWRLVNAPFNLADVETIVLWKSHRRMDLFDRNRSSDVEAAIDDAIAATHAGDVQRAVKALTNLAGVGVKLASAILTAMFPTFYTVCDIRASAALGQRNYNSLRYYVAYLTACRRMAPEYGVTLRDFDRANWQWSKQQSKGRARHCEEACLGYEPEIESGAR